MLEYHYFPIVEWTLSFRNTGLENTPIIADIQSLDTKFTSKSEGEYILKFQDDGGRFCVGETSIIMDLPDLIGVGIGESTAILVRGEKFTVMGKGSVVVINARKATIPKGKPRSLQGGLGVALHVFKAGQTFRFK